jgi:hypothetical protein
MARTTFLALSFLACLGWLAGCPSDESDDDSSAGDDDSQADDDDATGDDDDSEGCGALEAGPITDWDGAAALAVGDVAELGGDGGTFGFTLAEAGSYLAVVVSRDLEPDTTWDLSLDDGARGEQRVGESEPRFRPAQADEPVALRGTIGDPTVPEVGEVRTFEIAGSFIVREVEAEAIVVTDDLVVYEDITTENLLDPLDASFVSDVVDQFELTALPRERFFFHPESDVNADGHVTVLFSYAVNETGAMAFVTSCDLQPQDVCGYGNEQELIYAGIPDPEAPQSSVNGTTELLAHEFNHNIYFASRFLDNDATGTNENVYLTEGTSAMAQDLCGYNNGNLYVWAAALEDPWHTSLADIFVYTPGTHYYESRDGQLRGLAYLAFRYLYDRYGAEEALEDGTFEVTCGVEFLNAWFDSPTAGLDGVQEVAGLDADTYVVDFWTALGVHQRVDEGQAADDAYHFQDPTEDVLTGYQRGVDFDMTIHGWMPVTGVATYDLDDPTTVDLRSGGAAFFLGEGVDAGTGFTLTAEPGADAVVRVVRLD